MDFGRQSSRCYNSQGGEMFAGMTPAEAYVPTQEDEEVPPSFARILAVRNECGGEIFRQNGLDTVRRAECCSTGVAERCGGATASTWAVYFLSRPVGLPDLLSKYAPQPRRRRSILPMPTS